VNTVTVKHLSLAVTLGLVGVTQASAQETIDSNAIQTAKKTDGKQQTQSSTGAVELSEITVTGKTDENSEGYAVTNSSSATKTDTPIMETPASIQVIPKSVFHDQQAFRLEDVIKNVSGVQTQHSFGGDYETFVMRGFLQSTANYHNGIRIPATKFDLANVERVEVLKGTSAMLYGLGNTGGFVNTVTKQPSLFHRATFRFL
jgi:iron complex outermembrane recepter protein